MGKFLIALGTLIVVLAGGCSLAFVAETGRRDPYFELVYIFGGVPIVIGLGILILGIAVNRHKMKRAAEEDPNKP